MTLERDEVLALQQRAMRDWVRMLGTSSAGASVIESEAVTASVVPVCPQRSIANSVVYSDPAALSAELDALTASFGEAGIEAWTVWAPDLHEETIAELEARGHTFDGKPVAMALELERWQAPDLGDLDWDADGSGEDLGRLNDAAYGLTPGNGFGESLATPPEFVRLYQARVDDRPACVLGTIDHDDDLGFYFVATDPGHRGLGLASRLMAAALADARERGLRTSTLQASPMGEPVYTRLGFEPHFRMHLYERRAA